MDAQEWDTRYTDADLVWSVEPNAWIAGQLEAVPAGRALDLAAGEGRNSIWLARRGWTVTATDFSRVALDRGRSLADEADPQAAARITWECADVTHVDLPVAAFDAVVICYLHLVTDVFAGVLAGAAAAVAPGGSLLLIAHDRSNLVHGVGGPQDPDVLPTAGELRAALVGSGLEVSEVGTRLRPVGERTAIDLVLAAGRPLP